MSTVTLSEKILSRSVLIYAIVVSLLFVLFYKCHQQEIQSLSTEVEDLKKRPLEEDVKFWRDSFNNQHATVEQIELDKVQMNQYVDSISKILKIKSKQVESLTLIKTAFELRKPLIVEKKDTIYLPSEGSVAYYEFKFKDKWVDIIGTTGTKNDSIFIKGIDTITNTDYWTRKWFLGSKTWHSDFTNKSPYVKIEGVRKVNRQVKDPTWLIAPTINGHYPFSPELNFSKPQFGFGVSIIYYPLSIKLR